MTVRVLTLNIWHDSGPWAERARLIGRGIDALAPDLIGFQEVLRGPGVDLLADILEDRPYETDFSAASPFWGGRQAEFGNAVASRWPITARTELRLPDAGDGETRSAISIMVDSPHGPVSLTSTHLNWKLHHGRVRERQVLALAEHVRAHRPRNGFPPIVCGDFNAEPESAEIRYLQGLQSLDRSSVHFVDAFRDAGEGPGLTWSNRNPYARPWLEPERRIDYVFVGPPRRPDGLGMVLSARVVGNEPEAGVWWTDHFGVLAELRTEPVDPAALPPA